MYIKLFIKYSDFTVQLNFLRKKLFCISTTYTAFCVCVVSAHLTAVQISCRQITRSLWALETYTNPCFDSAWNKLSEWRQHCNVHAFLLGINLIFHIVIASGPHHVQFPDKLVPSEVRTADLAFIWSRKTGAGCSRLIRALIVLVLIKVLGLEKCNLYPTRYHSMNSDSN